jgi:predicted AlkP superfamily phosphohydrolase/phosphomutase
MKKNILILALIFMLAAWLPAGAEKAKKVLVFGIDGLDPKLLQRYADEGALPNFKKLMAEGEFSPLQTTMPPLSPIAWSTFITGMDPGGHGIFDFIHRDTETIMPHMSMAQAVPPSRTLKLGSWEIPLSGGGVYNLRKGEAFWQILQEHDIPTTVYKMPANFPPAETEGKSLSGMGTPDITGSPGTFSFYSQRPVSNAADITGGKAYVVKVDDNKIEAKLFGPENPFRREERPSRRRSSTGEREMEYKHPTSTVGFTVYLDPEKPIAKFIVGENEFILQEGEWSDWQAVDFEFVPLVMSASAIGRFYLKQVRPEFQLYVTPLQINPDDPIMPISTPEDWSHHLCHELGYFYTQELPEDTKAFTHGIFTGPEFWEQSQLVYRESRRALDYFLDTFEEGFLFFYYSSVDMGCHMLWQYTDDKHPGFDHDERLHESIKTLYQEMDESLGRVLQAIDDETTLIVMSDHGFAPFYWGVNINTWLLEKGYAKLRDPTIQGRYPAFANVDWSQTRAYALGLNGLYVNLEGREQRGIVKPGAEYEKLLDQLEKDLLEMVDPRNGQHAVTLVTRTHRDFHGPHIDIGPDIIVGYNMGYRSSWESPLGSFPREIFVDNLDEWSGDHAMDHRLVPGVLLTNRKITLEEPALYDLTVAILDEYGIPKTEEMIGEDCLGGPIPKGE